MSTIVLMLRDAPSEFVAIFTSSLWLLTPTLLSRLLHPHCITAWQGAQTQLKKERGAPHLMLILEEKRDQLISSRIDL